MTNPWGGSLAWEVVIGLWTCRGSSSVVEGGRECPERGMGVALRRSRDSMVPGSHPWWHGPMMVSMMSCSFEDTHDGTVLEWHLKWHGPKMQGASLEPARFLYGHEEKLGPIRAGGWCKTPVLEPVQEGTGASARAALPLRPDGSRWLCQLGWCKPLCQCALPCASWPWPCAPRARHTPPQPHMTCASPRPLPTRAAGPATKGAA